jgi:hypothetical protein
MWFTEFEDSLQHDLDHHKAWKSGSPRHRENDGSDIDPEWTTQGWRSLELSM